MEGVDDVHNFFWADAIFELAIGCVVFLVCQRTVWELGENGVRFINSQNNDTEELSNHGRYEVINDMTG